MSTENKNVNATETGGESIKPIPWEKRTMSWGSNTMLWLGGCISIGTLAQGSAQIETGLNLLQLFLHYLLATLRIIKNLLQVLDGLHQFLKLLMQLILKSAYGTKGNILPSMIRGLPAIVWYGYQTWLGGAAINNIAKLLFHYDNIWLFFILFQVVQILLSIKGFKGAKWVGNIGGTVIVIAMFYLLYICVTTQWDVISTNLMHKSGTWGMPFVAAIIAFFGNSTTVMLNASDYSREMKQGYSAPVRGISYFMAMVPATVMLGVIGAMASTATGIANPINAFAAMVDNKVVLIVTLAFIIFAQLSTNLASNVIPPAYVFMDTFKMKHRTAVILIGIIAVATCPWILTNDSSAAGLALFVKVYSAFFAPIFAILIVDYFILHKRNFTKEQLDDLYDPEGSKKGINMAAIIATIVGCVIGLLDVNLSFFTATIPTGIVYYLLMRNMKSCDNFRKGTTLEKK